MKLKLMKVKRATKRMRKYWRVLKTENSRKEEIQLELRNKYTTLERKLNEEQSVNTEWNLFTGGLTQRAQETVPNERRRYRQRWMTEEIPTKMEERRKYNLTDQERQNSWGVK